MTSASPATGAPADLHRALDAAIDTVRGNVEPFATQYPDDTTVDGWYRPRSREGLADGANVGWTTGFWPGMIWLAHEVTGESRLADAGRAHVASFASRIDGRHDTGTHDLGFLYQLSCVVAAERTGDPVARAAGLAAADALMERFLPAPGIFQAWGSLQDPVQRGRTIIDSLMNMPLLHWATKATGDESYSRAAERHVEQLARHVFRPDGSTFHTFYWDVESGEALRGGTEQGRADESCWARGQAWGVYGFALNYRLTGREDFLAAARRCADYLIPRLAEDRVPAWDLAESGKPGVLPDSSAAAITAAGLLEIADIAGDEQAGELARSIVDSLIRGYTPAAGSSNALLLHGVYDMPKNVGVDEGTLWGDYFYLEVLTRLHNPARTPVW